MAGAVRERMIDGAVQLLAQKGLQATSFSSVIELTGAPRGSIYHHFPRGKDQLVASAIERAGQRALDILDDQQDAGPVQVTEYFLELWRTLLDRANFTAGCAVLAVTVAADSAEQLDQAAEVFRSWRAKLAELFERGGMPHAAATRVATTLVAASEGAVVLSRAERSMEPFELVAAQLLDLVRSSSI
jgi:TetR/AcrR family transcriptional repressor of lmrAB and yxaGH operons